MFSRVNSPVVACLVAACALVAPNASAQLTLNWTRTISNDIVGFTVFPMDSAQLVVDGSGSLYVAGTGDGYRVAKYSGDGALLWHRQRSTNGQCTFSLEPKLAIDSQGSIVLLYQQWLESVSRCSCALTKFDSNGNELWSQTSEDDCFEIGIDGADGVNVFGARNIYLRTQKFSKDGVLQWAASKQANYVSYTYGVAGHSDGSVYVLSNGPQTDNDDIVIIKYNASGVEQWMATYNSGTRGDDWPGEMVLDAQGNVYVAGYSDPNGENDASAVHDIVTLKYSSSGQQMWVRRYSSGQVGYGGGDLWYDPWLAGIALDSQENVIVTGRLPGGTATRYDFATIKYDANGNQLWARTHDNTSANCDDMSNDVAVSGGGNVYVAGASDDTCPASAASFVLRQYESGGNPIGDDRRTGDYYYTFNGSLSQARVVLSPQGTAFVMIGKELRKYACVALTPPNATLTYQAANSSIGIASHSACAANWTVVSDAPWITVTSGSNGSGNGTVGYSVSRNESIARRIGRITIGDATFTVTQNSDPCVVTTPVNLVATFRNSSYDMLLSWDAVAGTTYEVQRKVWYSSSYETRSSAASGPYVDDFTFFGFSYIYRVRAVSACTTSAFSNLDISTNFAYTDDPLVAGSTAVKGVHLTQLRQVVDAVRKVASLSPGTYTDTNLAGLFIKAVHVSELRAQFNAALTALGIALPVYTDPSLGAGTPIKRAHIQELRDLMR